MKLPRLVAHGLGGIQDLPVPGWLFYWGAAVVLVASFLLLGTLWKRPVLERYRAGRAVGTRFSHIVLGPVRIVAQIVSVALFLLVFAAALVGDTDPFANLAPTWVYAVFWIGVPVGSVALGNVWRALSPWRAIADAAVWAWERSGREARPLAPYPERLGRWPAVVALFAFVSLELVYSDPSSPRALALAIALYTYVALFGMLSFGRVTWEARGECFAVLFGFFGRIAPLFAEEGRLRVRWPFTGLAGVERAQGTLAFLSVSLGSVLFDGYSRTTTWQDLAARVEGPYIVDRPGLGEALVSGLNLAGMTMLILVVAFAYVGACTIARMQVAAPRSLVPEFLLSLVPIAFAYVLAHYVSLLVIQGQFAVPLLSDPLGRGWDLFGTADVVPDLAVLSPNTIWYVQVGALVVGHVAGLAIAHDRAVSIFHERTDALRSQYAMLGLMILYTVGGLWVLSRG